MSPSRAEVREQIRQMVLDNLALGKGIRSLTDTESLVERGVIDSLGIFQVVAFLEENFGIPIEDDDVLLENFSSIDAIEEFVQTKLDGSGR
jgi:acyl carrier protein